MALRSWSERIADVSGPKQLNMLDYADDMPIGGNSISVIQGRIYNTPGNTILNTPSSSGLYELPGRYVWTSEPLDTSDKF